MPAIQINNLTKYYGDLLAVDDVSFSIKPKQIFGIIGPNGAGKSTLLNILSSQLEPTSGEAKVGGRDVVHDKLAVKRIIGVVPEDINLPSFLTVREYLQFVADVYHVEPLEVDKQLEFFEIEHREEVLCKDLSRGEKERMMLASAFIHSPKIVLLDEPFLGIDPITQIRLKKFLKGYAKKNTVVFCTHFLDLAKQLCKEVALMKGGRLITTKSTRSIKNMEKFFVKKVK